MKKLFLASFISVLTFSSVMAGESATTRPIGFSKDGKYFAYVEYVMQDGSGFTEASVKFLDVAKNEFVEKAVVVEDRNEKADVFKTREKALTKAAPILSKLGIGKNNVEFLVSRQITDTDVMQNGDFRKKTSFTNYRNFLNGGTHEVTLEQSKATSSVCLEDFEPKKIKVSLKKGDGKIVVLQEDKELPKSRGCAYDYVLQDIVVKEDTHNEVVIIVNVIMQGFEGPSSRTIAISGKLE